MTRPDDPDRSSRSSISHDDFLDLSSLAELKALYRDRGFEGADKDLLRQAQLDWHEVALQNARQITEKPEVLEAISCTKDGVEYHIYGVMHGLLGGDSRDYKDFIEKALSQKDWLVFENGLQLYYRSRKGRTIPDFRVLGWTGELALGLSLIRELPGLLVSLVIELLKLDRGGELLDFDRRYHALHPETRRGLEFGTLPSRLQIEYELDRWDRGGFLAKLQNPYAIVPRSMFMAGFAEGCAQRTGKTSIPIVVGDLHTTEIQHFLTQPTRHPIYESGKDFARSSTLTVILAWTLFKTRYLILAALPALTIIVAIMLIIAILLGDR